METSYFDEWLLLTSSAVWGLEGHLAFTLIERGTVCQHTLSTPTSTSPTDFWTWDNNTTKACLLAFIHFCSFCIGRLRKGDLFHQTFFACFPLERLGTVTFEFSLALLLTHAIVLARVRVTLSWGIDGWEHTVRFKLQLYPCGEVKKRKPDIRHSGMNSQMWTLALMPSPRCSISSKSQSEGPSSSSSSSAPASRSSKKMSKTAFFPPLDM